MSMERIWEIVSQWRSAGETKKTSAVLARAEANMPLPKASGTKYEAKQVLSPITPKPSLSGGFRMTDEEKARTQVEAIKGVFN